MGRPPKPTTDPASLQRRHMGLRVRAARLAMGWDTTEAAKWAGVSKKAWEAYESGQNMISALAAYRFFKRTDIPMEWFYAGDLRRTPYDLVQKLEAAAAEVGASIGGPVPEWPMQTERMPAHVPRRRGGGFLHEGE